MSHTRFSLQLQICFVVDFIIFFLNSSIPQLEQRSNTPTSVHRRQFALSSRFDSFSPSWRPREPHRAPTRSCSRYNTVIGQSSTAVRPRDSSTTIFVFCCFFSSLTFNCADVCVSACVWTIFLLTVVVLSRSSSTDAARRRFPGGWIQGRMNEVEVSHVGLLTGLFSLFHVCADVCRLCGYS